MILRSPQLLFLLLPVAALGAILAWRGAKRTLVLLRAVLFTLLVVALADPIIPGTTAPPPLLILVDGSGSIPEEGRDSVWNTALQIADEYGPGQTTLAAFGRNVVVATNRDRPAVDESGSDIVGALRLAHDLLGRGADDSGTKRRIVLISDGASTTAGVEAVAADLEAAGITVDVLPIARDERLDARVVEISVPAGLREGQSYRGEVVLVATEPTTTTLQFTEDEKPPTEQVVTLSVGRNVVPFSGTAGRSGVHLYRAELGIADAHEENNRLERAVVVGPPPRVLIVEREPDSAARLRDLLEQGGIQSEARRPQALSSRLSELERFDAIVLQDVPAEALSLDQQSALREYVRALGHGLLTLGGANSYGLGNYKDTPLEEVLPVDMQPPPQRERQAVALLLIIDRSASMFGNDPQTSKLEMAKGGAIAATQALVPDDRLGVLVFDVENEWIVPFTNIGEGQTLAEIQNAIASIDFGGGTDIFQALSEGLPALTAEGADGTIGAKHAVLLTDGRSYGDAPDYDQLVDAARQGGVTLSTIAIGEDADTDLLQRLAERGSGRYYFAGDPQDLPRLTLQETEIVREDPKVEGEMQPQPYFTPGIASVDQAHPTMRGFIPRRIPLLGGYIATTIKPSADMILESPDGDTVLAGWQFGLGRALAWTSDAGERWAGPWQQWEESSAFWTQVLAYTFPDPTMGPLQTHVEPDADGARIIAEALDPSGDPLDLANVAVRVQDPSGAEQTLQLKQVAPGRYETRFSSESGSLPPGGYRLSAALQKEEQRLESLAAWSQPYAAEYAGAPADWALLGRIAEASGGSVLESSTAAVESLSAPPPREPRSLWPWLAGAALLLWPLEIAIRRRWFTRT